MLPFQVENMSRLRSRSPHYRRFPWDEPDFNPRKVIEELDGNPRDRGHHPREGPEDFRDPYREKRYPEGPRRSPFQDDFHFRHQRHPDHDEFYHWRASPPHDAMHFENQRFSPRDEESFDDDRRRGEFRDDYQRFDDREGVPQSRGMREGLSPTQRSTTDHQQRKAGMGWRREEQGRDQGRFRDFSPGMRSSEQRAGGMEKEGRFPQHPNRGRQKENQRNDRGPPFKRPRREMEVVDHPGYRDMEDFGDRGYSVDRPKGGFRGRNRGTFFRGDSGPFVDEHSHDVESGRNLPEIKNIEDHRHYDPNFDRQRSPRSVGSSQERFRTSTARFSDREGTREGHFQDNSRDSNYHEPRGSPNAMRFGNKVGPANYRGRGRGGYNQGRRGRSGPHRNQPRCQDLPQGEQREGSQPIRDDYKDPVEKVPNWKDENRLQQWRDSRSTSLEQNLQRDDLNPERPPQRKLGWNDPQTNNMMVITEETLTIKVDMSRPVNQNSPLCYSSDRQLSLDLVNVGRQRLDFLPLLEHSGTYRETATHTGAFAQEIITLVHLVKEQYFKGNGVTLNQRFSAPQKGGHSEDKLEERTLNQRFTSSRGFSLDMDSLLDDEDDEPLFSRLGSMQGVSKQPLRGPGDLRHDLERRRQEKLEAVKVTITGSSLSQCSQGSVSDLDLTPPMDREGFSGWPGAQNRRREGSMGSRRGAYNRGNMGPQRKTNQFGNQRQNMHSRPAGPNW
ncbi:BCLAF1 and THRAP3 family member 3 isoform X1 [Girardinichthys multiradiatus]|uniref:BCLAF1 and THRAP3 family member 3 isoform X1 n=2 Tax=Girardinichthys multiradiatus TaxID=208333 RepID=UPI001FAD0FCC|nr:BCLAF1 and THRAP3 family member 3 isoform X1 [Girardinichthys multiradiatus]